MKAVALLSVVALVALAGCVKQPLVVSQTQTTSGVVCPDGQPLEDDGRCVATYPIEEQFDVP